MNALTSDLAAGLQLDELGIFEIEDAGVAEQVSGGGANGMCYDSMCGNRTCVQAVCAQALCVHVPRDPPPAVPDGYCGKLMAC